MEDSAVAAPTLRGAVIETARSGDAALGELLEANPAWIPEAKGDRRYMALDQAAANGPAGETRLQREAKACPQADAEACPQADAKAGVATLQQPAAHGYAEPLAIKAGLKARTRSGKTPLQPTAGQGQHEAARLGDDQDQLGALAEELVRGEQQHRRWYGPTGERKPKKPNKSRKKFEPKIVGVFITEAALEAARSGDAAALGVLLRENSAEVLAARDEQGFTALHMAAANGRYTGLVRLLLEARADLQAEAEHGVTALHMAAVRNSAAVKPLLEAKADLRAEDENGWVALHGAAFGGCIETVELLIEAKAGLQVRTSSGATPLQLAENRGHHAAAMLLDDERRTLIEALIREEEEQQQQHRPEGRRKSKNKSEKRAKKTPAVRGEGGAGTYPVRQQTRQKLDQAAQAKEVEPGRLAAREAARKQEEEYKSQLQEEQKRRQRNASGEQQHRALVQETGVGRLPAQRQPAALRIKPEELKRNWADEKQHGGSGQVRGKSACHQKEAARQKKEAAWQQKEAAWRQREAGLQRQLAELQRQLAELQRKLAGLVPAPGETYASGPALVSFELLRATTNCFSDVNLLSSGGQRTGVFRGTWRGQSVAVKRIDRRGEGFWRELTALTAVRHENVVRVIAYNERCDPSGARYLVLPLMVGGDLAASLPGLKAAERVRVLLDALRGLQALHEAGILHCGGLRFVVGT